MEKIGKLLDHLIDIIEVASPVMLFACVGWMLYSYIF